MTNSSDPGGGPSSSVSPRAIVAGHGTFPQGLISAVDQISGCGGTFVAISNNGLSSADMEEQLRGIAAATGIRVFFTDLPGGSATLAVRRLMRTDPGVVLVTATNLAVLLEFVFQAEADPRDAAKRSAEKGRVALAASGGE